MSATAARSRAPSPGKDCCKRKAQDPARFRNDHIGAAEIQRASIEIQGEAILFGERSKSKVERLTEELKAKVSAANELSALVE
ncbi:MAG: hypothetical protein ABR529_06725, partial [Actinomycetota bacterium]